jgi:hypothetical protein
MTEKTYTLREVADMTGISHHSIKVGCRNGTIEHIRRGDGEKRVHRVMSQSQINTLVQSRIGGKVELEPVDALTATIEATRAAMRRTPRRAA